MNTITATQGFAAPSDALDGVWYLNGVARTRKALKSKASRKPKAPDLAARERLAGWYGYDGHRGTIVYLFDKRLSQRSCEFMGLRFPALDAGVYCAIDAISSGPFHPDAVVAAAAIDGAA